MAKNRKDHSMRKRPEDCSNMAQLRVQIDTIDKELIDLLSQRAGYIDRAIGLKSDNGWPARLADRVEVVAQNARVNAEAVGYDADLAESLWRQIIEWSIDREEKVLGPSE
jgi:isochorismate pyruvate lyase